MKELPHSRIYRRHQTRESRWCLTCFCRCSLYVVIVLSFWSSSNNSLEVRRCRVPSASSVAIMPPEVVGTEMFRNLLKTSRAASLPAPIAGRSKSPSPKQPKRSTSAGVRACRRPAAGEVRACRRPAAGEDVENVVGLASETITEHRRRHPKRRFDCARCSYEEQRESLLRGYGSYKHVVHGQVVRTSWLAPRASRMPGAWGIGCTFCSNFMHQRSAQAGRSCPKTRRGPQDCNTKWARFEVNAVSQIGARGVRQHAETLQHRLATRAFFSADLRLWIHIAPFRLSNPIDGTVPIFFWRKRGSRSTHLAHSNQPSHLTAPGHLDTRTPPSGPITRLVG